MSEEPRGHMALIQQDLTEPEQQVRQAALTGRLTDLRTGIPEDDNPTQGATWAAARTVRAELLVELLTTGPDGRRVRAVKLRGARITGALDLEAATLVCPLLLQDCFLDEPITLKEAQAPAIRLPGCHLPGLAADQLATRSSLELNHEFTVNGPVSLVGARIGGILDCDGGQFANPDGDAIDATGLTVDQDLWCGEGFVAKGEVDLVGAHIGGILGCDRGHFTNPGGYALNGERLAVDGDMFCRTGFAAEGEVNLAGAHINGQLNCDGGRFTNPGGYAIDAAVLTVDQGMVCGEGFAAEGEVRLVGALSAGT
jgi:hypothetical protein